MMYMKKNICKYAPYILLLGGVTLWLIAFFLNRHYNHNIIWSSFLFILIIINTTSGIIINKLYEQVHTDMLTNLYSRRYFYTKMTELKSKIPVSLILIDIDDFKSINDKYGHIVGDHVLMQLAYILKSNVRKYDMVFRWGGEEFAIILPRTNTKEAFRIGDRIRKIIEGYEFYYKKITCCITISVGITSIQDKKGVNIDQIFSVADKALYKAKEKKNYVEIVIS